MRVMDVSWELGYTQQVRKGPQLCNRRWQLIWDEVGFESLTIKKYHEYHKYLSGSQQSDPRGFKGVAVQYS